MTVGGIPVALAGAHPLVAEWFVGRFGTPTEPQEQGWPEVLASRTTLISARTGRPLAHISVALSWVILLGGIVTMAVTLHLVIASYTSLPFWDGWMQISVLANGENPLSFAWLWRQHTEHRMPIQKLFLAADLRWFHARQTFLLASVLAVQFLHWLLLSWSMRVLGNWRGALWRTGAGLAAFCLFCPSQWENFIMGFQVCFVLPGLFLTLALISLLLYWSDLQPGPNRRHSWKRLVLSILAALGANYSLANGNLLWPLLVAAALLLRLPLAATLTFAATGLASIALYFYNYVRPPLQANPLAAPEKAVSVLTYLAAYFGSSWVRRNLVLAELIGSAGLLLGTIAVVRLPSYVRAHRRFAVQLVLTAVFCMASALVTAGIRLHFGVMQAFASRYQVFALLFWCCLGLLLLGMAASRREQPSVFLMAQVCLLPIMLWAAHWARGPIFTGRARGFEQNVAAAALLTGVHDRVQLAKAYPDPDYLLHLEPSLRQYHLSVFSTSLASQLGKALDSIYPTSAGDCIGALESIVPVEGTSRAARITGWAWDSRHRQIPLEVVATTDGVISGLAAVGERRPDIRTANPWLKSSYVGFAGYLLNANASAPLKLYAILPGSPPTACYFATK
jgi:hypothetical protein